MLAPQITPHGHSFCKSCDFYGERFVIFIFEIVPESLNAQSCIDAENGCTHGSQSFITQMIYSVLLNGELDLTACSHLLQQVNKQVR